MAKRRSKNPTMPVVLVNPSGKKRRSNPKRRRRGKAKKRRRNPTLLARRRNPKSNWKGSAIGTVIGMLSGGVSYAGRWGASYLPWKDWQQTLTFGGGALAASLLSARYVDERMGVGVAGGAGALIAQDLKNIIEVRRLTQGAPANGADAVYRLTGRAARGASAVYQMQEAGAMVRKSAATSLAGNPLAPSQSFKRPIGGDAGASRFVQGGPVRLFGPRSWATHDSGRRYVSAHNSR